MERKRKETKINGHNHKEKKEDYTIIYKQEITDPKCFGCCYRSVSTLSQIWKKQCHVIDLTV